MVDMPGQEVLPPSDRTEGPDLQPARAEKPAIVQDLELHKKITALLGPDFSQSDLGREIGVSPTAVNRWVNNKPVGDVLGLEEKIRFWLATIDERVDLQREVKETALTQRVAKILRSISRTNDLGILTGRAGIGKSCSLRLFRLQEPLAVLLTADYRHGNADCMIEDLWREARARRRMDDPSRPGDILVARFRGSNRLLMIDNAHSLTTGGLKWAYAFHNQTGCPVALIGNPLIKKTVSSLPDEDQYTTRTGQFREVLFEAKDAAELSALLLDQYAPDLKKDLLAPARQTCQSRGYGRRLKKQIRLAQEILELRLPDNKTVKAMRQDGAVDSQIAFELADGLLLKVEEAAK